MLNQFKGSDVIVDHSPVLSILDRALRTTEDQFDPLLAMHEQLRQDSTSEQKQWLILGSQAVVTIYHSIFENSEKFDNRKIAAEDFRFLNFLKALYPNPNQ